MLPKLAMKKEKNVIVRTLHNYGSYMYFFHVPVSVVCVRIFVSGESEEVWGFRSSWIWWKWGIAL